MFCLEVVRVEAGYGKIKVLKGVSLSVQKGRIVLLVGPNGAGKSTLAKVIIGLLSPFKGKLLFERKNILGITPEKAFRMGITFVPEERNLFWEMSVRENLLMGDIYAKKYELEERLEKIYNIFPFLKEREKQIAATLSGGEQQILAVARALVSNVKLLILDEPCNGMAAGVVERLFEALLKLREKGVTILLIDQNMEAIEIADYAYAMRTGEIIAWGRPEDIFSESNTKMLFLT
ncbi:ABC transporter ATP-binding protein [Candidatus Aerophobetes bacterium]|nr:ABC transporter ATP-binding protein [Candidatus Aerophobetes bacterium]